MTELTVGFVQTAVFSVNGRTDRRAYVQVWKRKSPDAVEDFACHRSWHGLTLEQYVRFRRLQDALADTGRA